MQINEIYRQTIISLVAKMLITVVGFFATIYFARTVGPSVLGLYFIFLAYYGIFDLISDGGFGSAAEKRISEGSDQDAFFSAYVLLRVLLSCISIILLDFAYLNLKNFNSPELVLWLALGMTVSLFASIPNVGVYAAGKVGISQIRGAFPDIIAIYHSSTGDISWVWLCRTGRRICLRSVVQALLNYRFLHAQTVRFKQDHIRSLFVFSFWSFLIPVEH